MRPSKADFIRQQGFTTEGCEDGLYSALMFQPRVIAGVVISSVVFQSPWLFLALATVLWWSALDPSRNPFDAFFNHVLADPMRLAAMPAAPPPRRFSQGRGRYFCHEHRNDAVRWSVAGSVADRGRLRRRVDECRRPPILPPSLCVPSAVVSNSRHALPVADGGARVNLESSPGWCRGRP